jgi:hypothetical protein
MATIVFLIKDMPNGDDQSKFCYCRRLLYQSQKSNKKEDLDAAVAEMMASKDSIFLKLW